jgi:small subunit ribosomal protein S1
MSKPTLAPAGEPSFGDLLEESMREESSRDGDLVDGTVVAVHRDHVIVDIGFKAEGIVPLSEFRKHNGSPSVSEGDRITVVIESREENESGLYLLSKNKADRLKIWDDVALAHEKEQVVEGVVVGRVKGGLSVDIGVIAFLPGSQVDVRPTRNLDKLIGQTLKFKVIKFNRRRNNIVLSRRTVIEQERDSMRKETLSKLQEEAILDGIVKNITDYGAFVDLGGIDGLLHITDMSWGRINHPSEMLKVGEPLRVKVLKYESGPERERVSLGLKQIQDDPWLEADVRYKVGTRVTGNVVSLTEYGAFIELEPGVEGLVHITEMSWTKRIKHPSKVYGIGDEVTAVVLDIDLSQKRISLGVKQTKPNPWAMLARKYPVGTVIRGPINNVTDFGVFVGVEDGIDGLVHVSDLSWSGAIQHPAELYEIGIEVEAVVLNIDVENERFSLGVKQLTDDPWRAMPDRLEPGNTQMVRVLKATPERAYVELEPGIEGILPVSQFGSAATTDLTTVIHAGDKISVAVQRIDTDERKIYVNAIR